MTPRLWLATIRYQDRNGRVTTDLFDFNDFEDLGDYIEGNFNDYRLLLTCDFVYTGANTG
jgi:hypothetical protein